MSRVVTLLFLLLIIGCDSKIKDDQNHKTASATLEDEISKSKSSKKESLTEFVLETVDGKRLHISEIDNGLEFKEKKGKALFLLLFGYRCPPCLMEIPSLIDINREHKDLEIVAIEVQGYDSSELKSFAKRKGIDYTLVSSDKHMGFIRYIQQRANWSGAIPFMIGLNKKGKVIIIHAGGVGKNSLEAAYQDLIKN